MQLSLRNKAASQTPGLEVLWFGLIFACAFLICSLASYSPVDSSWLFSRTPTQPVSNWCGKWGAQIAATGFYYFGLASWVAVLCLVQLTFRFGAIAGKKELLRLLGGWLVISMALATVLSQTLGVQDWSGYPMDGGGILGRYSAKTTATIIGPTGLWLWLAFLFGAGQALVGKTALVGVLRRSFQIFGPSETRPNPKEKSAIRNEPQIDAEKMTPDLSKLQEILTDHSPSKLASSEEEAQNIKLLTDTLSEFGLAGRIVETKVGPTFTTFCLEPSSGLRLAKLTSLDREIALGLGVQSVSFTQLPETKQIGVQVPNRHRQPVGLLPLLSDRSLSDAEPLTVPLGVDAAGKHICRNLRQMPHLLVAGTTGSGKSVALNTIICSLLYRNAPDELRFVLIDPKFLELSVYSGIPHLLAPPISKPTKALEMLGWLVEEMDRRYEILASLELKDLGELQFSERKRSNLPYIVVIIDEFSDLILSDHRIKLEILVQKLAQKARACGIHLITATQRPSVDVITGVIKSNFPARLAFKVASLPDSRTILDQPGAEKLLGAGDALLWVPGQDVVRIQCPLLEVHEIRKLISHIKTKYTG